MKKLLTLLSIVLFNGFTNAQSLVLDTTFNSTDTGFNNGAGIPNAFIPAYVVNKSIIQPDGKTIIAGDYSTYNGVALNKKPIRLNADGTIDSSFNFNASYFGLIDVGIMALEPDGKILLFGNFQFVIDGTYYSRYAVRLNPDGSIITSFDPASNLSSNTIILNDCAVQPDGKIILVGRFTSSETGRNCVLRMNPDGSLDDTFNPGGAGALFGYQSGTNIYNNVNRVMLQPDGKIMIAGNFGAYNGVARKNIARLNADGTLDLSFNPGIGFDQSGSTLLNLATLNALALQADGKVVVGGNFVSYNGIARRCIVRINTDGSVDTNFNIGIGAGYTFQGMSGNTYDYPAMVRAIVVQPDGKIVLGGYFERFDGINKRCIARLNADGTLDNTFNSSTGILNASGMYPDMLDKAGVFALNTYADQKILISGQFKRYGNTFAKCLVLTDAEGNMDLSFNAVTSFDESVRCSAVQSNGKILVGGTFTKYNAFHKKGLVRLNTDGSLDNSFNIGAGIYSNTNVEGLSVKSIIIQPDNKIVVAGCFEYFNGISKTALVRLNSDGSVDPGFTLLPTIDYYLDISGIEKIALQPDGKILMVIRDKMYRLNTDGSVDSTFNIQSSVSNVFFLLPDGKILVAKNTFDPANNLIRLNADGSLDTSFPSMIFSDDIYSIDVQLDGKILVAGSFGSVSGNGVNKIVRLNPDGTTDFGFYLQNTDIYDINKVKVLSNGKILITGSLSSTNKTFLYLLSPTGAIEVNFANFEINGINNNRGFIYDINQSNEGVYISGTFVSLGTDGRNRFARLTGTALGLDDFNNSQLKIYPNPTNGILNIDMPDSLTLDKVEVYNNLGQLVISQKNLSDNRMLDVSNLRSGIYYLKMNADDKLITRKFIKE